MPLKRTGWFRKHRPLRATQRTLCNLFPSAGIHRRIWLRNRGARIPLKFSRYPFEVGTI